MPELALLRDLGILWIAALAGGFICACLKQPTIAGYLLVGIAIGPHGLKLISHADQIDVLAELGVALLLFSLGLEVYLKDLLTSARTIVAGLVQIGLTIAGAWVLAHQTGLAPSMASGFIFGCVCALSSTAVVTKLLSERGEIDTIHGRLLIPMLIAQDLSIIPMVMLIPLLHTGGVENWMPVVIALSSTGLLLALVFFGATKVVPRLLTLVTRTESRELFVLFAISLCVGAAILAQKAGFTAALGAFLAGILVSEFPYGHQILADLRSMRDLFSTVFFVSIGMLMDPVFIMAHWMQVSAFLVLLIAGKTIAAMAGAMCATKSIRSAALTGISLAQIGEFSFVLATLAYEQKIIDDAIYNLFFGGAVISILVTPSLTWFSAKLASRLGAHTSAAPSKLPNHNWQDLSDHVIICGFGRVGQNIGAILSDQDIPFCVVEINPAICDKMESQGVPCIFGDVFGASALDKAHLESASALIMSIPDAHAAVTAVRHARKRRPDLFIAARAHQKNEADMLIDAGANSIVIPEAESGIKLAELAAQVRRVEFNSLDAAPY